VRTLRARGLRDEANPCILVVWYCRSEVRAQISGKKNSCVDRSMKEKRLYIHDVGAGSAVGYVIGSR